MHERNDELGTELRDAFGQELPGEAFDRRVMERLEAGDGGRGQRALGWLMPALAVAALLAVALVVWSREPDSGSPDEAVPRERFVPAGERFEATVHDDAGKPVAGALVVGVVKTWPDGRYQQIPYEGITDAKGRFVLQHERPESGQYAVAAAVFKTGYAFNSHYEFLKDGTPLGAPSITLGAAHAVRFRFVGKDGSAVAGATILPKRRKAGGAEHGVYEVAARPITRTSDKEGLATLSCFAVGDEAAVVYRFPGGVNQERTFEIKGSEKETIEFRQEDDSPPPVGPAPGPHVPQQEFRAGRNENMRYFLIGPTKESEPPRKGHALLVVLPGGSGSAEFNPFVKRILLNAFDAEWLIAQPVAKQWTADQVIVWPTEKNKVKKQRFSTEAFIEAVIKDAAERTTIDPDRVFALGWSSSGPALYAASLAKRSRVKGFLVAMSVFKPNELPSLKRAKGKSYYVLHSREDRVCPFWMAEDARDKLRKKGAKLEFATYAGGHGWHGDVYGMMRRGITWLEKNAK